MTLLRAQRIFIISRRCLKQVWKDSKNLTVLTKKRRGSWAQTAPTNILLTLRIWKKLVIPIAATVLEIILDHFLMCKKTLTVGATYLGCHNESNIAIKIYQNLVVKYLFIKFFWGFSSMWRLFLHVLVLGPMSVACTMCCELYRAIFSSQKKTTSLCNFNWPWLQTKPPSGIGLISLLTLYDMAY